MTQGDRPDGGTPGADADGASPCASPPLAGFRVVQLGSGIAPGYATKLLVDAGASVCVVEPPGGDPLRRWSAGHSDLGGRDGALHRFLAASKTSMVASPDEAADLDAVDRLLAASDAAVWSPSSPVALHPRLDPHELARRHPNLAVTAVTPFGSTGPWAGRPASDLTLQALSGGLAHRGPVERPPASVGGQHADWVAGVYGAIATLVARHRQVRGGGGGLADVSTLEALVMTQLFNATTFNAITGEPWFVGRRGVQPGDIEPTRDGYVGFALVNLLQHWLDFCVLIGYPEWNDDPDLHDTRRRSARAAELLGPIREWTTARTTDEVVREAGLFRLPVAPIGNGANLPRLDHFAEYGFYEASADGDFLQPTPPFRLGRAVRTAPLGPAPALGPGIAQRPDLPWPAAGGAPDATGEDPALPFAGLRVLDLTAFWAGPSATHVLAMLGAEVVHVESTVRVDGARYILGRSVPAERWWKWSPAYQAVNTDKLGITLDLSGAEGRRLLERLVERCDVVVENYSPRVVESWGLGWDRVRELNPGAVMVRMPAFGLGGPWRDRTGFAMTMEQISGMAWISGAADGPPTTLHGPCDPVAGAHGTVALLVALEQRRRSGEGVLVEVPMVAGALNIAGEQVIEHSAYGRLLTRQGNRGPGAAPQNLYACRDAADASGESRWVAVAVEDDAQWAALREALGDPGWARDERFATEAGRRAAHDELDTHLGAWCRQRSAAEVVEALWPAGVPVAPVLTCAEQIDLEQLHARGFFEQVVHPVTGAAPHTTYPVRFSPGPERIHRSEAPTLGRDNEAVLGGLLGLDAAELDRLSEAGVIGTNVRG